MFTGIIETLGTVKALHADGDNLLLTIESAISQELRVDQSVGHDGVCLTVTAISGNTHHVCAVPETLNRTTLGSWQPGKRVNLERCLALNGRLDGHIVQGHVDTRGTCLSRTDAPGHWNFRFGFDPAFGPLVIEKGSVAVNGTSLTCFNLGPDSFEVAIIPYTFEHTSLHEVFAGHAVNLEFDVIGKYIARRTTLGPSLSA